MEFQITREQILRPLQHITGVVERRQTLPILSHVLIELKANQLSLVATDLEVELVSRTAVESSDGDGSFTVPARKLLDICKALPDGVNLSFSLVKQSLTIKSGRSRFSLSTLLAEEFPKIENAVGTLEFTISQAMLKQLIDQTHFAMAQQDVRTFLNGMLFEVSNGVIRSVATDGHRLALNHVPVSNDAEMMQIIVPRKGVVELSRLLQDDGDDVAVTMSNNHICVADSEFTFTSKLLDGRFPDYKKVIPTGSDKSATIDRDEFKQAIARTSILSNEKLKGIRVHIVEGMLKLSANNPEQEEAFEELEIQYQGPELDVGFNATYLLDVLSVIPAGNVRLRFSNSDRGVILESDAGVNSVYVVMPLRL